MALLIRDLIVLHGRPVLTDPLAAGAEDVRRSFVGTPDAGRVCAQILRSVCAPGSQKGAVLLSGLPGSGRTHILRYVDLLMAEPRGLAWENPPPFLQPADRPSKPVRSLFIPVPASPHVDLGPFLCARLSADGIPAGLSGGHARTAEELAKSLETSLPRLAAGGVGMVVLENVSRRIRESRDASLLEHDRDLYRAVARAFTHSGILLVTVVDESHIRLGPGSRPRLSSLRDVCDSLAVSRNNLLQVVAATALKDPAQRQSVRRMLDDARAKFPLFGPKAEEFVDLYPLHASVFDALFRLRAAVPGFSPLHAVRTALKRYLDSPPSAMITVDRFFDHIEPELRAGEKSSGALAGLDEGMKHLVPRLSPALRPAAAAVLKAIALGSICSHRGTSVRSLAYQCLIEDPTGALSGNALASAILTEMEEMPNSTLAAAGERLERVYRFCSGRPRHSDSPAGRATQAERLSAIFPLMLFDWVHFEVSSWDPEISPRYLRESQSLKASLPEFEPPVRGVVCFKSIHDPLWSDQDVAALQASGASWVLLVLSPFERTRELESRLREIAARWDRILVWEPAAPTARELRWMQRAVPAYALPSRAQAGRARAKAIARRTLASLYVSRGTFRNAADRWPIAEEVSASSVALCLSRSLASLLGADVSVLAGSVGAAGADGQDGTQQAPRWAALMPGPEGANDVGNPEQNLLAWWAARLEVDCPALIAKLHDLPESMITTRMWEEIRVFESSLGLMRSVFQRLRMGEIPLVEALGQVAHHFGNDEARIARWRASLDNLAALSRWVPAYEHAHDYLSAAFGTGNGAIDGKRDALIDAARQPHHFLQSTRRDLFDAGFLEYKKAYIEAYAAAHADALGHIHNKIDSTSLRTLELLSNLPHADETNWHKVKLIGRWAQRNRCDLPVREILDRYPRCYCNFNPAVKQHLVDPGNQINRLVQDGIEHCRRVLRNARKVIIEDLGKLAGGTEASRQIAALISNGPLVPVAPECVDILTRIIQDHPEQFCHDARAARPAKPAALP